MTDTLQYICNRNCTPFTTQTSIDKQIIIKIPPYTGFVTKLYVFLVTPFPPNNDNITYNGDDINYDNKAILLQNQN